MVIYECDWLLLLMTFIMWTCDYIAIELVFWHEVGMY
jgi:hypothetical protein